MLTAIVREHSGISRREVEGPRDRTTEEDCCARCTMVEVKLEDGPRVSDAQQDSNFEVQKACHV